MVAPVLTLQPAFTVADVLIADLQQTRELLLVIELRQIARTTRDGVIDDQVVVKVLCRVVVFFVGVDMQMLWTALIVVSHSQFQASLEELR